MGQGFLYKRHEAPLLYEQVAKRIANIIDIKVKTLMRHVTYKPEMVCARAIDYDLDEEGRIYNLKFEAGCNGNLKAIGRLLEGTDARRAAELLRGNDCRGRGTSCADQLARSIEESLSQMN